MMSPSRRPARAAASVAAATTTPPLSLSSFFWASVRSVTDKPICCAAAEALGFSSRSATLVAGLSGSISAMVIARSREAPRRNTVTELRLPGLALPTKRGRSATFSMGLPSNRVMMSPASTPALSAGDPASTPVTKAPCALPRPIDSATSLVTGPICTPMRPRVTRPDARS